MTLRPSSAARQDSDVPTTRAGTAIRPGGQPTNLAPDPHPAPGGAGRNRRRRNRQRETSGTPTCPDATTPERPDITPEAGASPDSLTPVQKIMRARLAAMSAPRPSDDPETARLRSLLRDWEAMAEVTATVDQWQPATDDQRATLAALLHPHRGRRRRSAG